MMYYNATTMSAPGHLLLNVEEVSEEDHFYPLYKAQIRRNKLTSRERAEDYDVTGTVAWLEKGKMYKASSKGSFEWKAIKPGEHKSIDGINWATEYFCTKEEATVWAKGINNRHDQPSYEELGNVWGVHFHKFDCITRD